MTGIELSSGVSERVAQIARAHGLDLVVLFGSRAMGVAHADSDTDLAVCRRDQPLPLDDVVTLSVELGDGLCADVDLVDLRRADPLLLRQVFRRPVVLFETEGSFARERLRAFHRYEDYRPFLALERDAVRRKLQRYADRR